MDHIEVLGPVDMIQEVEDGLNILVDQQSEPNPDWKKTVLFVFDNCLLVVVDILHRPGPLTGVGVLIEDLLMVPVVVGASSQKKVRGDTLARL